MTFEIKITEDEMIRIVKEKLESVANFDEVEFDRKSSHWEDSNNPLGFIFVYRKRAADSSQKKEVTTK